MRSALVEGIWGAMAKDGFAARFTLSSIAAMWWDVFVSDVRKHGVPHRQVQEEGTVQRKCVVAGLAVECSHSVTRARLYFNISPKK